MRDDIRDDLGAGEEAGQIDPRRLPGGEEPGRRAVPPDIGLQLGHRRRSRDHRGVDTEQAERQAVAPRRGRRPRTAGAPPVDREGIPRASDGEAPKDDGEDVVGRPDEHRPAVEERGPEKGRQGRGNRRHRPDGEHPEEDHAEEKKRPHGRA